MRLWHESLIPVLPRQQLLGQHRECCALRGHGWNKPHATVNYVFQYSPFKLYQYHMLVIRERQRRGYQNDTNWENPAYRGKTCPPYKHVPERLTPYTSYPEHDTIYLKECLANLAAKEIHIAVEDL